MVDEGKGSENVEIVKRLYESFRTRDNAAAFELYADDIVWDVTGLFEILGFDRVYHGHDGVRAFWRNWLDAWKAIEWEQTEPEVLEDGRVRVLVYNQHNTGRETGIEIGQKDYEQFWTIENGKVTKVEYRSVD
jgi:ketosteroid isomerase-like protein